MMCCVQCNMIQRVIVVFCIRWYFISHVVMENIFFTTVIIISEHIYYMYFFHGDKWNKILSGLKSTSFLFIQLTYPFIYTFWTLSDTVTGVNWPGYHSAQFPLNPFWYKWMIIWHDFSFQKSYAIPKLRYQITTPELNLSNSIVFSETDWSNVLFQLIADRLWSYRDRVLERCIYLRLLQEHVATTHSPQHSLKGWYTLSEDYTSDKPVNQLAGHRFSQWFKLCKTNT